MAQLLVWGKLREVVQGDLPAGLSVEEVYTLDEVAAHLDEFTSALVVADPARLEAERPALEAWLKGAPIRVIDA